MTFRDHFSQHAESYAAYRPRYPDSLFAHLASLCKERTAAWDCATGNGQAAVGLTKHFSFVAATDASRQQLSHASRKDVVGYCSALAERPPFRSKTIDLVTIAQALHWIQTGPFFTEVARVLKSGGIVVAWCYNLLEVDQQIDQVLLHFYQNVVGPYWAPERRLLEAGYKTIAFPFDELNFPEFQMESDWGFQELTGYLRTWSASQEYARINSRDPVEIILPDLSKRWGDPKNRKKIRWPLSFRAGVNA